jgi:hypothetical protein
MIASRWKELVEIVFGRNSSLWQPDRYPVIMHSFCCLWNRLLKSLNKISSTSGKSRALGFTQSLLDSNDVLLKAIESSSLPKLCLNKCLSILLQCVPYCDLIVEQGLREIRYATAAHRNLSLIFENTTNITLECMTVKRWVLEILSLEGQTKNYAAGRTDVELQQCDGSRDLSIVSVDCAERDTGCKVSLVTLEEPVGEPVSRFQRSFRKLTSGIENEFLCGSDGQQQVSKFLRKTVLLALRSMAVVASSVNTEGKMNNFALFNVSLCICHNFITFVLSDKSNHVLRDCVVSVASYSWKLLFGKAEGFAGFIPDLYRISAFHQNTNLIT